METSLFVQTEAFRRASVRLKGAIRTGDDYGVYISVMEALAWLTMIAWRAELRKNDDVCALLFARHRGSHQWASVVYREEGDVWRWRPAVSLPMPPPDKSRHFHPRLRERYERLLERQPVLDVFARLPSPLSP